MERVEKMGAVAACWPSFNPMVSWWSFLNVSTTLITQRELVDPYDVFGDGRW